MDVTTLEKGLELNKKINQCTAVLDCFEWKDEAGNPSGVSTNPRIIIEYDGGDDREDLEVPFELNVAIIKTIKYWTLNHRELAVVEFNSL